MLKHWVSSNYGAQFSSFDDLKSDQFGNSIHFFSGNEEKLDTRHIGLIGLDKKNADLVREKLFELSHPWAEKRVIDLGNLRNEDPSFAIQCLKELKEGGIIPIIIGKDHNTSKILFEANTPKQTLSNPVWIQEKLDNLELDYWNNLVSKSYSRFNTLGILGTQAHFRHLSENQLLENIPIEELRLGALRDNGSLAEPILRDADFVSIDANVLKFNEAPAQFSKSPNGFFGEELCQLSRYAGISDRIKGLSISGFDLTEDKHDITSSIMAQVIWYFVDGFINRKGDYPLKEQNLTEYLVDFKAINTKISFWKSTLSGRWWIQLPKNNVGDKNMLIACTYEDYLSATQEEIPERLIKVLDGIRS